MADYPVMLNLRGRSVVIIGGGRVAARKVTDLLEVDAQITVISPTLHPILAALGNRIQHLQTVYAPGMLADLHPLLVFAATDSHDVNQQIADEAHDMGILVNRTDDGSAGDFSTMAVIRRGEITIGLATGGTSPALASNLRVVLQTIIGEEYATLARWLGELRPLIKANATPKARRQLWKAIIASPALDHLRSGDEAGARAIIDALIADANHSIGTQDAAPDSQESE